MNPKIVNINDNDDNTLNFTLQNVNVSIANSIRRILLSEIPVIILRTTPYEKNNVSIITNTSRLNNEIIKQRLSCIPIMINDMTFPLDKYQLEIDKKNNSDSIDFVTTNDIVIRDIQTGNYLKESEVRKLFPLDSITQDPIDIVRLRPKILNNFDGEHLKLTATFDIGTAKQDGAFNVVSTCSYAMTPDNLKIKKAWKLEEQKYKKEKINPDTIEYKKQDWFLLNAQRQYIENSFDFIIETIGQYTNRELIKISCEIMINKLQTLKDNLQNDQSLIKESNTTIENCYDIILNNECYTLGKAVEYMLYETYYIDEQNKILTFCGFKKPHPLIDKSVIRVGFIESTDIQKLINYFTICCDKLINIYTSISRQI
jgi:DNA-directed RNA polymerase alpha subunit